MKWLLSGIECNSMQEIATKQGPNLVPFYLDNYFFGCLNRISYFIILSMKFFNISCSTFAINVE